MPTNPNPLGSADYNHVLCTGLVLEKSGQKSIYAYIYNYTLVNRFSDQAEGKIIPAFHCLQSQPPVVVFCFKFIRLTVKLKRFALSGQDARVCRRINHVDGQRSLHTRATLKPEKRDREQRTERERERERRKANFKTSKQGRFKGVLVLH